MESQIKFSIFQTGELQNSSADIDRVLSKKTSGYHRV